MEEADQNDACCVCFLPTDEVTPCGHILCCGCQAALKSNVCPVCRRILGRAAPIDFEALLRTATGGDLRTLHRAHRQASGVATKEAREARAELARVVAERLRSCRTLSEFSAALVLAPLAEPSVLSLAKLRIDAGARQVCNLDGLLALVGSLQVLRNDTNGLTSVVDRALMEAAQNVVPALTLQQLVAGAADFGALWRHPGIDGQLLTICLQEALTSCIGSELTQDDAREFVSVVQILSAQKIIDESTEGYIASLFAARMSSLISSASLGDIDQVEADILPRLPRTSTWTDAATRICRDVERQVKVLRHLRASPMTSTAALGRRSGSRPSSACGSGGTVSRGFRVDTLVRSMERIDADISSELSVSEFGRTSLPPVAALGVGRPGHRAVAGVEGGSGRELQRKVQERRSPKHSRRSPLPLTV